MGKIYSGRSLEEALRRKLGRSKTISDPCKFHQLYLVRKQSHEAMVISTREAADGEYTRRACDIRFINLLKAYQNGRQEPEQWMSVRASHRGSLRAKLHSTPC